MDARRAFTLVEVLVVIAIIAVLISILVPSLAAARRASCRCVSAMNLRSLAGIHFTYSTEFHDALLNPFNARTPSEHPGIETVMGPPSFATAVLPTASSPERGLTLFAQTRTTEPFAHIWGSYMAHYLNGTDRGYACFRDPGDKIITTRHAELTALGLNETNSLFDTSYWYPPTFWLDSSRYRSEHLQPILPVEIESRWLGRNRFDHPPMPSQKALLFERFDTTRRRPMQWNNPAARPQVAFVDGSVRIVKMADLHALGEIANTRTVDTFRPSGYFDPEPQYSLGWLIGPVIGPSTGTDPYETGNDPYPGTTSWRQYLYATRDGVRGIDVQR